MWNKLFKKIWLISLCLASLALVGCFHIPDEDWLPSRNKVDTWNIQKNDEVEQAVNSLIQWIDIVSSRNETKNSNESEANQKEEPLDLENETISDENSDQEKIENIILEE